MLLRKEGRGVIDRGKERRPYDSTKARRSNARHSRQLPTPFGSLDLLLLEVDRRHKVNAPPSSINRTNGIPDGKGITTDHRLFVALSVNSRNGLARDDYVVRQRGLFSDSENDEERSDDLSATVIRQPCSKTQ